MYAAFHNAMACSCSHNLGLSMSGMARKDVVLAGEDEEFAAKAIPFDVVIGSAGETQRWHRLRVQLAENEASRIHEPPVLLSPSEVTHSSSRRRIKWSPSLVYRTPQTTNCVIQTATPTDSSSHLSASTELEPGSAMPTTGINDLCRMLHRGKQKAASLNCYGHISCRSSKFNLYHQDCQPEHLRAISLQTILQEKEAMGDHSNFNYTERLKVALALSYSVLHLFKTPWLAKIVTPEDIVFLREHQDAQQPFYYLDRPFLSKGLAIALPSTCGDRAMHADGRPVDLTILSLGLLLIQIIIGRPVDDLGLSPDIRMDSTVQKMHKASEYISSVMESGGMNYADAVQWCLGSIFSVACLDDERFAQDFHGAVIVRLEGDLGLQSS